MLSFATTKIKNKKNLQYASLALLFLVVVGFAFPQVAFAADFWASVGSSIVKAILYPFFVLMGWFVGGAVTIFGWAVDPSVYGVDGVFNKASTYTSWKFVRDFFNLFFILTLLYTAFTIVFQVASNYKKTLLSIVLAALFVNFSFPITRVVIDATNVPMYFFINVMLEQKGSTNTINAAQTILGPTLSASAIQNKLIPEGKSGEGAIMSDGVSITQLLTAIVFLFMFAITLMVVALLLVVRVVALLMLVIFSAVGFAGSVIPGMKKYSDMWWDKLWQYALFGPIMLLMLYIAVHFFEEVATGNMLDSIKKVTAVNSPAEQENFYSTMVSFSITLIMMWMSIIVASSSSVAGAGVVGGFGQKAMKWVGKKSAAGATYPARKFSSGVGQGVKTRFNDSKFGKFLAAPSRLEAYGKGIGKTVGRENIINVGKSAQKEYKTEQEKFHTKRVGEEEKRMEEERASDSQLRSIVASPAKEDKETVEAAVRLLSKRGGFQDSTQLTQALTAIDVANAGNPAAQAEKRAEVIKKADKELFKDAGSFVGAITHLGSDIKSITQLIDKVDGKAFSGMTTAQYQSIVATNPTIKDKLDQKIKKEGQAKILVDHERAKNVSAGMTPVVAMDKAFKDVLGNMDPDALAKQRGVHADRDFQTYLTVELSTPENRGYYQEVFKRMQQNDRQEWITRGNVP